MYPFYHCVFIVLFFSYRFAEYFRQFFFSKFEYVLILQKKLVWTWSRLVSVDIDKINLDIAYKVVLFILKKLFKHVCFVLFCLCAHDMVAVGVVVMSSHHMRLHTTWTHAFTQTHIKTYTLFNFHCGII